MMDYHFGGKIAKSVGEHWIARAGSDKNIEVELIRKLGVSGWLGAETPAG
jgi:hypothetical protein